ncbi:MAG: hypothetical protein U0871_23960 [Gemmataceae bacterium]
MNADHRHELETNSLAQATSNFVEKVKSGKVVSPKVLGVALAVVLVGGTWWFLATTNRRAASQQWAELAILGRDTSPTRLEEFAQANKDTAAGRLARLEAARLQLGPDGIAHLQMRDADRRAKGITSIEAARDELVKLSDEFKGDKALQATCLMAASEAELALVGVAKTPGGTDFRGTVGKATELLRKAADAIGPTTPVGEKALARAKDLDANRAKVEEVGLKLNGLLTPPPSLAPPLSGLGTGPKPPEGPIPTPKPPELPKAGEGPKPPTAPVTPAPEPKKEEPKKESAPTAPTKK